MAGEYDAITPYHFALNNPISLNDPTGLEAESGGNSEEIKKKSANNSEVPGPNPKPVPQPIVPKPILPVTPPVIKPVDINLIVHGGATKAEENNTFKDASDNLNKNEYNNNATMFEVKGGGRSIVRTINSQPKNSIQTLDVFTHSSQTQLHFNPDQNERFRELYTTDDEEKEDKSTNEGADIGEIKYGKFKSDSVIEFHGCNTGDINVPNNICAEMSKRLYEAGKTDAVVIGHATKSNPNHHKTLQGSDYRHGLRRVYHNGKLLFYTKKEGKISKTAIRLFLKRKEKEVGRHDDTKHKLIK